MLLNATLSSETACEATPKESEGTLSSEPTRAVTFEQSGEEVIAVINSTLLKGYREEIIKRLDTLHDHMKKAKEFTEKRAKDNSELGNYYIARAFGQQPHQPAYPVSTLKKCQAEEVESKQKEINIKNGSIKKLEGQLKEKEKALEAKHAHQCVDHPEELQEQREKEKTDLSEEIKNIQEDIKTAKMSEALLEGEKRDLEKRSMFSFQKSGGSPPLVHFKPSSPLVQSMLDFDKKLQLVELYISLFDAGQDMRTFTEEQEVQLALPLCNHQQIPPSFPFSSSRKKGSATKKHNPRLYLPLLL